jgi:hypothetical protein
VAWVAAAVTAVTPAGCRLPVTVGSAGMAVRARRPAVTAVTAAGAVCISMVAVSAVTVATPSGLAVAAVTAVTAAMSEVCPCGAPGGMAERAVPALMV